MSTLFNDPDPNPSLATIDRIVTALDAGSDFDLVPATQAGDEEDDQAEDGEAEGDEAEADEAEDDEAEDDEDDAAEDDAAEDDEAEDDAAEDDAAEDDEAEDDEAEDDEQASVVGALREQNTQLQRRVVTKEAEIDQLREQGRWSTLKKLATAVGGGLVGAGITVAVLKRRRPEYRQ